MCDIEQQLITAAKDGKDNKNFGHLVEMHQVTVRGYLRRLTKGNTALADDLAQETFLLAFDKITSFNNQGSFKSWLLTIAYRSFLMYIRKQSSNPLTNSLSEDILETEENTKIDVIRKIDIEDAIMTLKKYERSCLSLCYSYGMSHSEISHIMDMPIGTVKSHIKRGKEKLKLILSPEYEEMQC